MNIILLRLLEYLGHPNLFICAIAYTEVRGPFQFRCLSGPTSEFILLIVQNIDLDSAFEARPTTIAYPCWTFPAFLGNAFRCSGEKLPISSLYGRAALQSFGDESRRLPQID